MILCTFPLESWLHTVCGLLPGVFSFGLYVQLVFDMPAMVDHVFSMLGKLSCYRANGGWNSHSDSTNIHLSFEVRGNLFKASSGDNHGIFTICGTAPWYLRKEGTSDNHLETGQERPEEDVSAVTCRQGMQTREWLTMGNRKRFMCEWLTFHCHAVDEKWDRLAGESKLNHELVPCLFVHFCFFVFSASTVKIFRWQTCASWALKFMTLNVKGSESIWYIWNYVIWQAQHQCPIYNMFILLHELLKFLKPGRGLQLGVLRSTSPFVGFCGFISLDVPRKWRGLGEAKEIPKVVHEELNRMESELREQIRELQEAGVCWRQEIGSSRDCLQYRQVPTLSSETSGRCDAQWRPEIHFRHFEWFVFFP